MHICRYTIFFNLPLMLLLLAKHNLALTSLLPNLGVMASHFFFLVSVMLKVSSV